MGPARTNNHAVWTTGVAISTDYRKRIMSARLSGSDEKCDSEGKKATNKGTTDQRSTGWSYLNMKSYCSIT